MAFTTLPYLAFFSILFVLYYLVTFLPFTKGRGFQKWLILIANLVFYAWASPWFLLFLGISSALVYGASMFFALLDRRLSASLLEKEEKKLLKKKFAFWKKCVLILVILIDLGLLIVPKYTSFVLANINALFATDFSLKLMLPLGLSFYTFQNVGYLLNVYWGKYPPQRNPLKYLTYISYFPHVLQGPLEEYEDLSKDLFSEHEFDLVEVERGFTRVLLGVMKKLWISTQIGLLINPFLTGETEALGMVVPFVAVGYAIQLYADFSGYMDIACGCSKMLGITIAENFDRPYFSTSVASYWRRWHSTLGAWFRNYVFYPLMRSRAFSAIRKKLKKHKYLANVIPTSLSLAIVWLLIGFWHGADWSYVIHGIYHGIFVISASVFEPLYDRYHKKFPRLVANPIYKGFTILRTFLIVCFGYLFFAPGNLEITLSFLQGVSLDGTEIFINLWTENAFGILSAGFGTIVLFFLDLFHSKEVKCRPLVWVILLVVTLVFGIYSEADASQFLYFRF